MSEETKRKTARIDATVSREIDEFIDDLIARLKHKSKNHFVLSKGAILESALLFLAMLELKHNLTDRESTILDDISSKDEFMEFSIKMIKKSLTSGKEAMSILRQVKDKFSI